MLVWRIVNMGLSIREVKSQKSKIKKNIEQRA
jgi:hypothetical protein